MTQNSDLVDKLTSSSNAVGVESLMNILKNYARIDGDDKKAKQLITVGVVGFPNVGKSSVINSLKRTKAAQTGNTPGVTKVCKEVTLDKNIVLIDSPGVVLTTTDQTDSLVLRSAIKVEDLIDPMRPVEALVNRIDAEQLMKFYRIGKFTNADNFLGQVARKRGFLGSGGVANIDQCARAVLRDYMQGKLVYHTAPPVDAGDDNLDEDEEMDQE